MSNVVSLHGLTSAHRFMMARIQDLCADITLNTEYVAGCHYAGVDHSLSVTLVAPAHQAKAQGGDGSYTSDFYCSVTLPPSPLANANSLNELASLLNRLAEFAPNPWPGGAA